MNKELFDDSMPKYRVTCGFPSTRGTISKNRTIGQCFSDEMSDDKTHELIVSMTIDDDIEVAATLAHEMVHAVVGIEAGHRKPFRDVAIRIGLTGKMTATIAGEKFIEFVKPHLKKLGKYPHSKINYNNPVKKQTTRMIKCECEVCGYVVRTTRSWIDEGGLPECPAHGPMGSTYRPKVVEESEIEKEVKPMLGKWTPITPKQPSFEQEVLVYGKKDREVELIKKWIHDAYYDAFDYWMPAPKVRGK